MSLYWHAGFETGDLTEVQNPIQTSSDYGWSGHDPNSVLSVVQEQKFNGQYVCKAEYLAAAPPPEGWRAAGCKQEEGIVGHSETYFGAAFYIPSSFDVPTAGPGWANIMQAQEAGGAYRIFGCLIVSRPVAGGPLMFQLRNDWSGSKGLGPIMTLPLDRFFTAVMYVRSGASGNVQLWIDRVLVADWSEDFSGAAMPGPGCDCGLYSGHTPAGIYLYFDEMRVASTLELATPVSSTPIPPSVALNVPLALAAGAATGIAAGLATSPAVGLAVGVAATTIILAASNVKSLGRGSFDARVLSVD